MIKTIATSAVQRKGAWVILRAASTGRFLVARRSKNVNNGKTWNFFGGGVDEGETFVQAVRRELYEESKLTLSGRLRQLLEYKSDSKHNKYFLLEVPDEVVPILNEEHDKWMWLKHSEVTKLKVNPPTAKFFKLYNFKKLKMDKQPIKVAVEQ